MKLSFSPDGLELIRKIRPSNNYPDEYDWIFGARIYPCHRGDPDMQQIQDWLLALTNEQLAEFCDLMRQKGTWQEDHILMDWILEYGGKLWYRHVLWTYHTWQERR